MYSNSNVDSAASSCSTNVGDLFLNCYIGIIMKTYCVMNERTTNNIKRAPKYRDTHNFHWISIGNRTKCSQ